MPRPPLYGIPDSVQHKAIAICAILAVASLGFCLMRARLDRSPLPVYLFAAGALTVFFEPYPDVLGAALFPQRRQIAWISSFGREIPLYIGLTYMFYWAPAWPIASPLERCRGGEAVAHRWRTPLPGGGPAGELTTPARRRRCQRRYRRRFTGRGTWLSRPLTLFQIDALS